MFEKCLPPIPANPFKSLDGLYEVSYKLTADDAINPLRYSLSYKLQTKFPDLLTIVRYYQEQNLSVSLHTILKVLNLSVTDLSMIPAIQSGEVKEVWEITTDETHIKNMGRSKHFASCYNSGVQPNTILTQARTKGIALVRKLDSDNQLKERFLIAADVTVGEGQFRTMGRIKASNYKGSGYAAPNCRIKNSFDSLAAGKARKLTPEEVKDFKWI